MTTEFIIAAITIVAGLIAWMAKQLWDLFKETRDDVKKLLLESSARYEELKQIKEDIRHLYHTSEDHDKRLQKVQNKLELIIEKQKP